MNDSLTPFEIEVLLYYYTGQEEHVNTKSEAYKQAIFKFQKAGMLVIDLPAESGTVFKREPLELYMKEIQKVKLPIQVWVIPPTELEL